MQLPDRIYDWLKWFVVIVLPACGSLWAGLSKIWDLPYATEIPATIMVICTFLGAILCISTAQYNKATGKHEATYGKIEEYNEE